MHPDISEFSYGYALTEELVNRSGLSITAAPLFPSLIAEGKKGGGFDVCLPFVGFPLFLQFKLSHCMVKASAFETTKSLLHPPFYRMHLRPLKHSQQHNLLLDLENKGYPVYYAAPHFHLPAELNNSYMASTVVNDSVFFKPSDIGVLPNIHEHHIAFKAGSPAYLCSNDPRVIRETSKERKRLDYDLLEGHLKYPKLDGSRESISNLAHDLVACVRKRLCELDWISAQKLDDLAKRNPKHLIGYLSRTFFGCEAILVGPIEISQLEG